MINKSTEKGQALILIALAAVVLFGFAALAIDGSRVFADRRNSQNAADTAALAAALAKIRGQNYSTAALNRAASNGYSAVTNSTVVVQLCSDTGVTCTGLPAGADPSEYIQVKITSIVPMTFGRVLGWLTMTNRVEAIARAQVGTESNLPEGAAMISLKPTGTSYAGNGNFNVNVVGGGIFSNSNSNCSTQFAGNGTVQAGTGITIASGGTQCKNGNMVVPAPVAGSQIPYPPSYSFPVPNFTCSGNGAYNAATKTYTPGNYNQISINNGTVTFAPGNYCFFGDISINGNSKVTANNVNFRINASTFSINGNSTFTCSNMVVHGAGGTGIEFNGNGSNLCTGVTFYMQVGKVVWNGNVANTFLAPTSGPYQGLLIYMPYGNNTELTINGNSGNQFTGSIIAVSSPVTINGNSGSTGFHSQIVGYTISVAGNSNTTINYDALEQAPIPVDPNIQFTH